MARRRHDRPACRDPPLPEEEVFTKITFVGQVFAEPGQTAAEPIVVEQEGDYFAVCFVPQGMTEVPSESMMPGASPDAAASLDPAASPDAMASPDASASAGAFGPPHFVLGMQQEFTVTAAGSSPGPLPSPMPSMDHGASMPPASPEASPAA